MQHRHEVVDVTFPAGDETTEVMQPGEEAFDLPAPPRATQAAAILRDVTTAAAMRGDHLDAVRRHQGLVERVAVIAAIANQPRREIREEAGVEGWGDEVWLIRRSAGHVHGDRKTMAVDDRRRRVDVKATAGWVIRPRSTDGRLRSCPAAAVMWLVLPISRTHVAGSPAPAHRPASRG